MELLLWRWSTAAQITSAAMIAVFFVALSRSDPRAELRWWRLAWIVNVAALGVTIVYWYLEPPESWRPLVRALYISGKTTFLLLLVQGAYTLVRPGLTLLTRTHFAVVAAVCALLGAFVLSDVTRVGVGQQLLVGVILTWGAILVKRADARGVGFLGAGMIVRALLGYVESAGYVRQLSGNAGEVVNAFIATHSTMDTAAEWMIALGCVLAVAERTQTALRNNNDRLLAAQEDLRRLVDKDPLTGLHNRRALPEVFRAKQPIGATLLFFDLDGFKSINDLHGHHVGDECLKQFAAALRDSFRPEDTVVRFAGDEFLVVASGLDKTQVDERVGRVEWRLRKVAAQLPSITFSVGLGELRPGGNPEAALQEADEAMYRVKGGHRRAAASA